jgi:SAM-dependent methyltransferase
MTNVLFRSAARLAGPLRRLVRPHQRINAALWDTQYALGMWSYLDGMSDGAMPLSLIETWAPRPSILDLGCGTSANLPLSAGRYRHYHGVDISGRAIAQARALRRPDTSFEVADIREFRSTRRYDAILLREVIYYLSVPESERLLRRLPGMLTERGRILVQVYDTARSAEFVRVIRGCGLTVAAELPVHPDDGPAGAFFVLIPGGADRSS